MLNIESSMLHYTTNYNLHYILLFLFSLLILISKPSLAQETKVDSLLKLLDTQPKERLAIYIDLLPLLYDQGNDDQILEHYPIAIDLAISSAEFDKAGRWSIELFQLHQVRPAERQQALEVMQKAASFSDKVESSRTKGNIYLKLAAAYYDLGNFEEAIAEYTNAKNNFSNQDSLYIADALFFRGQARDYKGEFINALNDYQQAALLYELSGDEDFEAHVQNSMSIIFGRYGMLEEAEKIRLELLEKYRADNNMNDWAIVMYNRAGTYRKAGFHEENINILSEVYEQLGDNMEDPHLQIGLNLSMANHYAKKKERDKYRFHFDRADSIKNAKMGEGSYLDLSFLKTNFLGEMNFGNPQTASAILRQYTILANNSDQINDKLDALEFEAELNQAMGNYAKAFESLQKWTYKKDSIFAVNKATSFAYYQTLYETEKKERELLNKTMEIENITTANQKKLFWIIGISICLVTILILLYLYRNLQAEKSAKKMQEQFSRDLLVYQEEERKRISKDLHDGLGQSLLLIKNKVAMSADPSATGLLNSAIEELRGISRSLHPFKLEELGLTQAIQNTLDNIDEETEIFISAELDTVDSLFDKNEQLQIYRMVQEVFNNILKHAQASAVRVMLVLDNRMVNLSIEDNGIGFDFSEKYQDFGSLGLKTIKERTASLKGTMKVDSEKGKGTKFSFYFYK
ncbi:ATP-binding protein [Mongoliibacter ruber]|uniref:histidine kinase n=1 Tax=Mongoliibacter ruber TaxID=1750599 RepID=A0A2T0WR19_9BACT|nr:ATP-binding protein [Mongoliibacter ruber]PRY89149.1 signal transduction histidine kinase [Mongoliibacter ruber]